MGVFCSACSYTILHRMLLLSERKDTYILLVRNIMTSLPTGFNTVLANMSFEHRTGQGDILDRIVRLMSEEYWPGRSV